MKATRWASLFALFGLALGLYLASRVHPYQIDDAFITYRFAKNAVQGHPFQFNVDGPRVEGFSSPFWLAALTSIGAIAGTPAIPHGSVWLGAFFYIATALLLFRSENGIAALAWACLPTAVFYAVTGLEPCAFAFAIAAFALGVAGRVPRAVLVTAAVAAAFIRPEAPWLVVSALAQVAAAPRALRRETMRRAAVGVAALALAAVVLVAARWGIFHEILPNTYYAKPRDPELSLAYLARVFGAPWTWALALCAVAGATSDGTPHRGYLLAGLSWIVACILEGGDWMPQARMMLPAFVFFALASGGVAERASTRLRFASVVALALFVVFGTTTMLVEADASAYKEHTFHREDRNLAKKLVGAGVQSVAAIDIGELGFRYDVDLLDLAGLTDARIAHAAGAHMRKQVDRAYLFDERRPDAVVLRFDRADLRPEQGVVRLPPEEAMSQIEMDIAGDLRLGERYRLAMVQYPDTPRALMYIRAVFLRRDFVPAQGSPLAGPLLLSRARQ